MKNIPNETELLELLTLAKETEKYAKETSEIITEVAHKWEKKPRKVSYKA